MNSQRILSLGLILVTVSSAPAGVASSRLQHSKDAGCPRWDAVRSPPLFDVNLNGLSAASSDDVWAVGSQGGNVPLTEHWDGRRWRAAPNASQDGYLAGVWGLSSSDAWAVGSAPGPHVFDPLIEHWDGTAWAIVSAPAPGSYHVLSDVVAITSTDVWAVGYYTGQGKTLPLVEHWDGTIWSVVSAPLVGASTLLFGLWAVSATDVWAVGYYLVEPTFETQPVTMHWDGQAWTDVAAAPPPEGGADWFTDVSAASSTDVWAVGFYGEGPTFPLVEHWDGSAWSLVDAPGPDGYNDKLYGVWALGPDDAWAVGDATNDGFKTRPISVHWDGTSWSLVPASVFGQGSSLGHVAGASSSDLWAVGNWADKDSVIRPLTEHSSGCGP